MKIFRAAALIALLTGPAYAQTPHINLMQDVKSKTPEEIARDKINEQAYKDSLRKIPDAKPSSDPWGSARSVDAPKTEKATQTKTRVKTGSTAN